MEMACVRFGVMNYYGNHGTIFGVPLPTLFPERGACSRSSAVALGHESCRTFAAGAGWSFRS